MGRLRSTAGFLGHLGRDLLGTLRARMRRTYDWVVYGNDEVVVAVDIFPFAEAMTGVGWYEWNLLASLDERNDGIRYNLYAHTFLAPGEQPPPVPGARKMRLRVHQVPEGFLLPLRPTMWVLRRLVEPVLRVLDGNDVGFAPNFFPARRHSFIARRLVITVHDLAFAVVPEMVAPETLAFLRAEFPGALRRAERVIAVSEATAGDLLEHFAIKRSRVHTIHEGLDLHFAHDAEDKVDGGDDELPQDYVLFVSTIEPRKNVVGVLRAFALMVEWGYQGQLVMVGRWGWRTEAIRDEIASSPVRRRIVHLDYVERERMAAVYSGARALLFPSWLEGFGLPILESMACGTPVVTSGRSAMPEVAGPAGVYVDPESAHGIATGAVSLIEDDDHHARLSELGRERARRFSWDRAAEVTANVFRRAAGKKVEGPDEYRV
ncbi:MAG: glycosyltransferase family 1 protein [Thermoanaerobaculales bacterium]|jgi:glycosyltransferase involved in cell wall biosynthesis|nr:glycosyltransferase family 1 protein [Thermoanaerobaculales bacterium]